MIFLHVPKCAGTSVITALRKVYGERLYHDQDFRNTKQRHVAWQWQKVLDLTPITRFRRLSPEIQAVAGHFTHGKYHHKGWPMFVFLRAPWPRLLSQFSIGSSRENTTFTEYVKNGANSIPRMVGDLSRYFMVGLQEHWEESMEMLEMYSGLRFERPFTYRNHHKREKYMPTEAEIKVYQESNQLEIELYNQARIRFYNQRRHLNEWKQEQANQA